MNTKRAVSGLGSVAVLLSLVAVWWAASHAGWISRVFLPTPEATLASLREGLFGGELAAFTHATVLRMLLKVMPSSSGISLAIPSTKLKGKSNTRPTSRITALAAMVPKVAICETASKPYFCLT